MKNKKQQALMLAVIFSLISSLPVYAEGLKVDLNTSTENRSSSSSEDNKTKLETELELEVNKDSSVENTTLKEDTPLKTSIVSSSEVDSDEDLKIFSSTLSKTDSNVSSVKVSGDTEKTQKIWVGYKYKTKLFGFIPMYVQSTNGIEVGANSEVKVYSKLPWWNFLTTKTENYNKIDIEGRLENNPVILNNAQTEFSAKAKAEVAEAILKELEASAKANINIE